MAKKLLFMLLCSCLAAGMLAGCGNTENKESEVSKDTQQKEESSKTDEATEESSEEVEELDPVELKWWVIVGENSEDEDMVEDAVNEYLATVLPNTTVDITFMGTSQANEQLTKAMTSGEAIDIAWFGWMMNYESFVKDEVMYPLDELLAEYGQGIVDYFGEEVIDLHRASDGNAYFLPAWQGLVGKRWGFYAPQEYVDVMGAEWAAETKELMASAHEIPYYTAERQENAKKIVAQWDAYLEKMQENGTLGGGLSMRNDPIKHIFGQNLEMDELGGYTRIRYIADEETYYIKGRYAMDDVDMLVVQTIQDWYAKGYIREDAMSYDYDGLANPDSYASLPKEQWFAPIIDECISDNAAAVKSASVGVDLDVFPVRDDQIFTTGFSTGMFIPGTSENPERAMMLLNIIYTDPTIHRLLVNGIEGVHYNLDDQGIAVAVEGSQYSGCYNWTLGTCEHSYPTSEAEIGYYADLKKTEENARTSYTAGYSFAPSDEYNLISSNIGLAIGGYASSNMYTADYDTIVAERKDIQELVKANGYEDAVDMEVEQFTAWAEAQGKKVEFLGYY